MRKVKFISLILVLCMTASAFIACGNEDNVSKATDESSAASGTSQTGSETSAVEESSENTDPLANIPNQNLGGTVTFLVENNNNGGYASFEIMPYADTYIEEYVDERNNLVEAKLGIEIAEIRTDTMTEDLRNAALSDASFDIAMPYMTTAGPLIAEGLFYDLYDYKDIINFNAPYWDKNAEENLSIGGKLYMTTGDFSVLSMDVTHCMLYNKTLINQNGLEDPNDLVESGDWTMDKMLSMAKAVTADTDGVSGITFKDTIGLFINTNYANSLFIGSGEKFAGKNSEGIPELTVYTENSTGVVQKIFDIFNDDAVLNDESFNNDAISAGYTNCYWAARDALGNDRALFVTISLSDVLNMAEYQDCDFGLLVTPKYTKEQEDYYSYISIIYATGCVIPVSNQEPERAALVLDTMAAASTNTVKFNYYERILKLQKFKDEESEKMLDFIFDNRVYDIGALYNWNNLRDFVSSCVSGASNTFTSSYNAQEDVFKSAMQDTIDFFS